MPCTQEQVQQLILDRLVRDFDYVFCITIASSRSPIFDNAQRAIAESILQHKVVRQQAALGNVLDIQPLVKGYRNQTFPCAKLRNFDSGAERLFNYAARHGESGLLAPILTVCYAGELKDLFSLPGYSHLALTCSEHGVRLLSSMMSMAGVANVGDGALGLSFADGEHEFDG